MKELNGEVNGTQRLPLRRVVVLRALPGLGDFLCVVPALRALRRALPKAHIDLLGLSLSRQLAERYSHYLDGLIDFPGFPGLGEQAARVTALPTFLSKIQARKYDLALQMHGDGSITNLVTLLLGAKRTAGFYRPGQYCPDENAFLPYPQDIHEIQRNLALVRSLDFTAPRRGAANDEAYEFPLTPGDHRDFERLAQRHGLTPGDYVCVHAGAKDAARRWAPDSFIQCSRILQSLGFQIVLTGTSDEAAVNAALRAGLVHRRRATVVDLSGRTSLGSLALLLSNARLVLCNDTGVSHLAAAMAAPSVVVFLGSDPQRWAPPDRDRHIAVTPGAGGSVSTDQVISAVQTLLDEAQTETAGSGASKPLSNADIEPETRYYRER